MSLSIVKTILLLLLLLGGLLLLGYQTAPLFHLSAALHTRAQMRIRLFLLIGNVLKNGL